MRNSQVSLNSNKKGICYYQLVTSDEQQEELKELFHDLTNFYNLVLLELKEKFNENDFDISKFCKQIVKDTLNRLDFYKKIGTDILTSITFKAANSFIKNRHIPIISLLKTDETFNSVFLNCEKCRSINFNFSILTIKNIGQFEIQTISKNNFSKKPKYYIFFKKNNKFFLGVLYSERRKKAPKVAKLKQKIIQPALF